MIVKSKKIIVLCLLFVIILTACKKENSNSYYTAPQTGTTQIEQTNFNDSVAEIPPPRVATEEELTAEDQRFKDLLGSLKANHLLSKVRLDVLDQDIKNHVFLSEDPAFIQQWVTLLKKMKTSVTQNDMALGPYGFFVAFYDKDENIVPIASTRLPYIYTPSETTMHVVDNYSELKGEFDELLKQIVPEELLSQ